MKLKIKNSELVALIDSEDFDKVKDYTWRLAKKAWSDGGYVVSHINLAKYKTKTIYLHRIVTDCPDNMVVDHINGNTLDNRKKNLRICTQQENNLNRRRVKKT